MRARVGRAVVDHVARGAGRGRGGAARLAVAHAHGGSGVVGVRGGYALGPACLEQGEGGAVWRERVGDALALAGEGWAALEGDVDDFGVLVEGGAVCDCLFVAGGLVLCEVGHDVGGDAQGRAEGCPFGAEGWEFRG